MKKRLLSLFAIASLWLAMPCQAQNYDFSAVAPSGQTLYYKIVNGGAEVSNPCGLDEIYYCYNYNSSL